MSSQVILSGELVCSPLVQDCGVDPFGGVGTTKLDTTPSPKPAAVSTGMSLTNLAATSWTALPGIGTTVTEATLLYFRCASAMKLRLTTYNASGNVQAIVPVYGTCLVEFDPSAYLLLAEVMGTGQAQYFASGDQ